MLPAMIPDNPTPAPRSNARKSTLLVVEDNADQWALILAACQEAMPDVEVVRATGTGPALTYLDTCRQMNAGLPKLILLDLYMPDAEPTWQLLQTLKQGDSPYLRMPVVVFSMSDNREDVRDFYQFGGTSYIVKPADYDQWVNYLQTLRLYWWETVTLPHS